MPLSTEQKPKILFIYQPFRKFEESIGFGLFETLKNLGYNIDHLNIATDIPPFENKHSADKILNILRRNLLSDKQFIRKAERRHFARYYKRVLADNNEIYDYALVITPDGFDELFLKSLSKKCKKIIGYMWDGIFPHNYENLKKERNYYHELYCFDPRSLNKYPELRMKFCTNYFLGFDKFPFASKKYEISYLGGIGTDRKDQIAHNIIDGAADQYKIWIHYEASWFAPQDLNVPNVTYTTQYLYYNDTINLIKESVVNLDICRPEHSGLSFRFFEALCRESKIITNNQDVQNYEFFHPDNILILDYNNFNPQIIREFIAKPFHSISKSIISKYAVENWIKYVLNLPGNIPIRYGK